MKLCVSKNMKYNELIVDVLLRSIQRRVETCVHVIKLTQLQRRPLLTLIIRDRMLNKVCFTVIYFGIEPATIRSDGLMVHLSVHACTHM